MVLVKKIVAEDPDQPFDGIGAAITGEGIGCLDWTHHQVAGVSIDFSGTFIGHWVRYTAEDTALSPVYPATGGAPSTGTYAIAAACH